MCARSLSTDTTHATKAAVWFSSHIPLPKWYLFHFLFPLWHHYLPFFLFCLSKSFHCSVSHFCSIFSFFGNMSSFLQLLFALSLLHLFSQSDPLLLFHICHIRVYSTFSLVRFLKLFFGVLSIGCCTCCAALLATLKWFLSFQASFSTLPYVPHALLGTHKHLSYEDSFQTGLSTDSHCCYYNSKMLPKMM